ncbi:Uma2 family endonuclease, partial [Myxococcota bacterium]
MSAPLPETTSRAPGPSSADDDQVMETPRHWQQMLLLVASLQEAWDERDDFYIAGRLPLRPYENHDWGDDLRDPDVLVAVNTERRERQAWIVSAEGQAPDLVIELISPSTETADRVFKRELYASVLGVAEYVIYDPMMGALDGFDFDPNTRSYLPKERTADGCLHIRALGVWLGPKWGTVWGISANWLRWLDRERQPLLVYGERLASSERRLAAERGRAEQEYARAEQERERADQERQRVEQEHDWGTRESERAEKERQRAEHEYQRAEEAQLRAKHESDRAAQAWQRAEHEHQRADWEQQRAEHEHCRAADEHRRAEEAQCHALELAG